MIQIEELEKVLQGCISRNLKKVGRKEFIDLFEHLDMANAENARLRKAIEDAPHELLCNTSSFGKWDTAIKDKRCNCWKSKALGEQK